MEAWFELGSPWWLVVAVTFLMLGWGPDVWAWTKKLRSKKGALCSLNLHPLSDFPRPLGAITPSESLKEIHSQLLMTRDALIG